VEAAHPSSVDLKVYRHHTPPEYKPPLQHTLGEGVAAALRKEIHHE